MSFKAVQAKIAARSGEGMKAAGAMLAASTRRASPAARKKNPKLNRVKGKAKHPEVRGRVTPTIRKAYGA